MKRHPAGTTERNLSGCYPLRRDRLPVAGRSAGQRHNRGQNVLSLRVARCDVLTKMFRSARDEVQSIDSEHHDESTRGEDDGAGEEADLVAVCRRAVGTGCSGPVVSWCAFGAGPGGAGD